MTGKNPLRIGLFGIGLDTYWGQFEGLLDRLESYQRGIHQRLARSATEIVDVGMVDTVPKARDAGDRFRAGRVDLIFLYISTYALSATVLPVVQRAKVPVIVLNLQPVRSVDYATFNALGDRGLMTGEWLGHCQACCVPEIASAFNRADIDYHLVTGTVHDEETWAEIDAWLQAAHVAAVMAETNVGILGHYYDGMLDIYSDMTQQAAALGCHFTLVEMDELVQHRQSTTQVELADKLAQFEAEFDVSPECAPAEIERTARTSCALDKLVAAHNLGSLAYYYEGTPGSASENVISSVVAGNSLLTAHGVPVSGECDIKNVQAMKILDTLGVGGSFSEFYALDFDDDVVLLGHDGPGHLLIAEGRVGLVPLPLFHGKPGQGLSIQMQVRNGPVTLLSLAQDRDGRLSLVCAEGESVPGPILEIGNTNSRYRFSIGCKAFLETWARSGPAHHCAIGVGHVAHVIERLAALWDIGYVRVC